MAPLVGLRIDKSIETSVLLLSYNYKKTDRHTISAQHNDGYVGTNCYNIYITTVIWLLLNHRQGSTPDINQSNHQHNFHQKILPLEGSVGYE
jgi:hypothetical protein